MKTLTSVNKLYSNDDCTIYQDMPMFIMMNTLCIPFIIVLNFFMLIVFLCVLTMHVT